MGFGVEHGASENPTRERHLHARDVDSGVAVPGQGTVGTGLGLKTNSEQCYKSLSKIDIERAFMEHFTVDSRKLTMTRNTSCI